MKGKLDPKKWTYINIILLILGMQVYFNFNISLVSAQDIEITLWYTETDSEQTILNQKIENFEILYPDISVNLVQKDLAIIGDEFRNAYIMGNEPQIIRTPSELIPHFAHEGIIQDISSEFSLTERNDFMASAISLATYNSSLWGWPQNLDCPVYLFNDHIFEVAGINTSLITYNTSWTWLEFEDYTQMIIDNTTSFAVSIDEMFQGAEPYYFGMGAYFFEENIYTMENVAIESSKSRDALIFLKNLIESNKTPTWENQNHMNNLDMFKNGEIAIIVSKFSDIPDILDSSDQFDGSVFNSDNLGIMQLPHDEENNYGAVMAGNYYTISINTNGLELEAAVNLCEYLSSYDAMVLSAVENNHISARPSVLFNNSVVTSNFYRFLQVFQEQSLNSYDLVPNEHNIEFKSSFGLSINEFINSSRDLGDCLNQTYNLWFEEIEGIDDGGFISGFSTFGLIFIGLVSIIFIIRKRRT
jgi:ABC-type glycerol-3-phosphate transport system substrate-binding protein